MCFYCSNKKTVLAQSKHKIMGRNRNKNIATVEKVAVWRIKFTSQQAQAFWDMFGSRIGCFMSKEDFVLAARKGDLVIRKGITWITMGFIYLIDIHVWGSGGYYTPLTSAHSKLRGQSLHGERILQAVHHEVGTNGKSNTEITWIEEMLNLVVEE